MKRSQVFAVVLAVAALAGGGAVAAASSSGGAGTGTTTTGTTTTATTTTAPTKPARPHRGFARPFRGGGFPRIGFGGPGFGLGLFDKATTTALQETLKAVQTAHKTATDAGKSPGAMRITLRRVEGSGNHSSATKSKPNEPA